MSAKELATVPIHGKKKADGSPLVLSDIGKVVVETWPLIGDAVIDGGPGLLLVVEKYPWANTLETTKGVEDAIDELRPGLPELKIDPTIFPAGRFHRGRFPQSENGVAAGLRARRGHHRRVPV